MTQDEIIEMANEVGFVAYGEDCGEYRIPTLAFHSRLKRFAALVAAKERKACAKMFDGAVWAYDYREIAAAIRARGDQT